MHFRVRKNIVQLVRNTYDPVTKRAVASVVARMPLAEPALTDDIRSVLTEREAAETEEWISTQHRLARVRGELAALDLPQTLALASQWFDQNADLPLARSAAQDVLHSWAGFRIALKKSGLTD